MQVRCPHCRSPIELTDESSLHEVACPSCGSSFSLVGTEDTQDYSLNKRRRIAHFELIEQLGAGAFGSVWRARDTELDREVAIKIPRKGQLTTEESEKFLREARAAAQLNHPGIVSVHEVGREDDTIYIVSALVEGVTLTDWLSGHKPTPREAAELCTRIADALQHAHDKGVTHRDLKPGNLMIDRQSNVHLMDFGLAKRDVGEVTMTVDGQVLGTPAYLSPEAARGDAHKADARSDIYSLGVIFFEMLTGERPFRGNARMLIHQLLTEDAPSPRKLNAAIPKDLETICLKCLEKEPRNRFGTARLVSEELHRFLGGEPIHARPISSAERAWRWCQRNPMLATLEISSLFLLLTVAVGAFIAAGVQREARARTQVLLDEREQQLYISDMNAARQAWDDSNIALVGELLRRHFPNGRTDLRGFEWYHLRWLLANTGAAPPIPTGISRGVAYCATEQVVAISVTDRGKLEGQVFLVDAVTRKVVRSLGTFDDGWRTFVEFSPDGRWLAYPAKDHLSVRLYDMVESHEVELGEGDTAVTEVAFWGKSGKLVIGRTDGSVGWVDVLLPKEVHKLKSVSGEVGCLAVSDDESLLAIATMDPKRWYAGASPTSNSKYEDEILIVNLRSQETMASIDDIPAAINDLVFLPNDRLAAACEGSDSVEVWSTSSMAHVASLREHSDAVRSVAVCANGLLASASRDNTIKLWDVDTLSCTDTLKGHSGIVDAIAFSRDGDKLVSGSQDYTTILWDLKIRGLHGFLAEGRFTQLTFVDDTLYAKSVDDEQLVAWSMKDRKQVDVLNGFDGRVGWFAISSDGLVALAETEGNISVWDLATGEQRVLLHHGTLAGDENWRERQQLAFSPDGELLAAVINDGNVLIWRAPFTTRTPSLSLARHAEDVLAIAFGPYGKFLATGHRDKQVRVWNTEDGSLIFDSTEREGGHRDKVMCLAFASDGHLLASGSFDNTIKIWDIKDSGRLRETLRGHSASIHQPSGVTLQIAWQELQCDRVPELEVVGAIDFPHTTFAEQGHNAVAIRDLRARQKPSMMGGLRPRRSSVKPHAHFDAVRHRRLILRLQRSTTVRAEPARGWLFG